MLLNEKYYVCIHKLAKQHAEASFTQLSDPLTRQTTAYRLKCTHTLQSHSLPLRLDNWNETLTQTIMNRTQVIVLSAWPEKLNWR